jgi:hypothetical protein
MGCCNSKSSLQERISIKMLFECIKRNNLSIFTKVIEQPKSSPSTYLDYFNNEKSLYNGLSINVLGYSLAIGNIKAFQFLHNIGCSVQLMEHHFLSQGVSSFEILCIKGYTDVLSYYFPLYIVQLSEMKTKTKNPFLDQEFNPFPDKKYSPIQLAVIFEHIQIITAIYSYVKIKSDIFQEIDLDYREETTGMNCPLLAVKSGNFALVKYLHTNYICDFCACNTQGQNAIEIAVIESKLNPEKEYGKIICYLVDIIGLKLSTVNEKVFNSIEDKNLREYLNLKLKGSTIERLLKNGSVDSENDFTSVENITLSYRKSEIYDEKYKN